MPVRLSLFLAAGLACVLAQPALAAFPGANGRISFDAAMGAQNNRQGDIWTIGADGAGPVAALAARRSDSDAVWSPNGRQLVFQMEVRRPTRDRPPIWEIGVMNADGSGVRQLTRLRTISAGPSWTPD